MFLKEDFSYKSFLVIFSGRAMKVVQLSNLFFVIIILRYFIIVFDKSLFDRDRCTESAQNVWENLNSRARENPLERLGRGSSLRWELSLNPLFCTDVIFIDCMPFVAIDFSFFILYWVRTILLYDYITVSMSIINGKRTISRLNLNFMFA